MKGQMKPVAMLLFLLLFVISAFSAVSVSAKDWVPMNTDHDLNNPSEWIPATWGLAREGVDIFPEMTMTNGIATTTLNSHAGRGIWDSASYKQDIYQGSTLFQIAPLTSESRISYRVKPFYENPGNDACFNIFVEIWIQFDEPVGVAKGRVAELMFKQRVITSSNMGSQPDNSYTSTVNLDAGWGDWYFITYRLPDVPFNQWTQQEFSWNEYFYPKLEEYGVDLSKGHIYALVFGVEGYSASGGAGAQWDFVNCMTDPATFIMMKPITTNNQVHKENSTSMYADSKPMADNSTNESNHHVSIGPQTPVLPSTNNSAIFCPLAVISFTSCFVSFPLSLNNRQKNRKRMGVEDTR